MSIRRNKYSLYVNAAITRCRQSHYLIAAISHYNDSRYVVSFGFTTVLFVWLPQVSASASAVVAALMRTIVVRFADADAVAYYIATADFIGVSRRPAASDAVSCVNETNKS
ncbi:hypothetical protein YC2023_075192 [Brassica napus]